MGLSEQIQREMAAAVKAKDKGRLSALRMIRASLQNREIERRGPLTEAEEVGVLASLVKRSRESIEQFRLGKREDLVRKEEAELQVVLSFMPAQLEEREVREALLNIVQTTGAKGPKDLGKVMKAAMDRFKGKADGRIVQQMAKEILSAQGD